MTKIAEHNVTLLQYHAAYPEVSTGRLGKLFGITKQRVEQIIKRAYRDQMVVEYFRTHPETTPAEVSSIFHISLRRARCLSYDTRLRVRNKPAPKPITTTENAPIMIASILL